jgi:hypothetical protein
MTQPITREPVLDETIRYCKEHGIELDDSVIYQLEQWELEDNDYKSIKNKKGR